MKKTLLVLSLLALPTLASAQLLEAPGNPIIVAGYSYLTTAPTTGSRGAAFLSANIAGIKPWADVPVYLGGVGAALPTSLSDTASRFGNFIQLTVPAVTWLPRGNDNGTFWSKVVLQAGYSYVLTGDVESRGGAYAAVGYAWNSPAYLKYRREVKRAKARGLSGARLPPNPYDVK